MRVLTVRCLDCHEIVFCLNTLRPRQNGRHFADDMFKCVFLNENIWISIRISLNLVPNGSISYIPALVQILSWRRPGDKPLSEPMTVSLLGLNELTVLQIGRLAVSSTYLTDASDFPIWRYILCMYHLTLRSSKPHVGVLIENKV